MLIAAKDLQKMGLFVECQSLSPLALVFHPVHVVKRVKQDITEPRRLFVCRF